jgi:hypothetical protein
MLYNSTRRCNSARRGRLLQCECCVASLPAGSANADGEHRRHIRRLQQCWERWRAEWAGAVRRREECTWLSPALYAARFPRRSAYCFGVHLRARGCCSFGSAVRRSAALPVAILDGPVGAAQQQLRDGAGHAIARGRVQRRVPARQTAAGTRPAHSRRSPQAETAHRSSRVWAFTSASDATSDRTIRRLPNCAASCSAVQPSLCTAGPG